MNFFTIKVYKETLSTRVYETDCCDKPSAWLRYAGFESFNANLYCQAGEMAMERCEGLEIIFFSDRDITAYPSVVGAALQTADVFFASLVFDYDRVMWLRERVQNISIGLVFESALESIGLTQLGKFEIGDKPKGMSKPILYNLLKL